MSVGRYTLSRSAVARLMGPAYERERAGERARAREREREREFIRNTGWNHILHTSACIVSRCRFVFRITLRFWKRLWRALFRQWQLVELNSKVLAHIGETIQALVSSIWFLINSLSLSLVCWAHKPRDSATR